MLKIPLTGFQSSKGTFRNARCSGSIGTGKSFKSGPQKDCHVRLSCIGGVNEHGVKFKRKMTKVERLVISIINYLFHVYALNLGNRMCLISL